MEEKKNEVVKKSMADIIREHRKLYNKPSKEETKGIKIIDAASRTEKTKYVKTQEFKSGGKLWATKSYCVGVTKKDGKKDKRISGVVPA